MFICNGYVLFLPVVGGQTLVAAKFWQLRFKRLLVVFIALLFANFFRQRHCLCIERQFTSWTYFSVVVKHYAFTIAVRWIVCVNRSSEADV